MRASSTAYREILWNLVRKELKVKYTASVLGAVWSLLNPVVFLAVFTFVTKVLNGGIEPTTRRSCSSGLLAWNLFSVSLSNGAQSVIANANLVKKVYFPREILPLATVGVCLVDFVLQSRGAGRVLRRVPLRVRARLCCGSTRSPSSRCCCSPSR